MKEDWGKVKHNTVERIQTEEVICKIKGPQRNVTGIGSYFTKETKYFLFVFFHCGISLHAEFSEKLLALVSEGWSSTTALQNEPKPWGTEVECPPGRGGRKALAEVCVSGPPQPLIPICNHFLTLQHISAMRVPQWGEKEQCQESLWRQVGSETLLQHLDFQVLPWRVVLVIFHHAFELQLCAHYLI